MKRLNKTTGLAAAFLILAGLVLLSGCVLVEGQVYQEYSWYGSLDYFYDDNPRTPYTVYNGVEYRTYPGEYYMEYRINGSLHTWYMYYTIDSSYGFLGAQPEEMIYAIFLGDNGPSLYTYSSYSLQGETPADRDSADPAVSEDPVITASGTAEASVPGPVLGTMTREYDFGTVTLTWGQKE